MKGSKLLLILIIVFASCQKELSLEGGNDPIPIDTTGSELGVWKFISMQTTLSGNVEFEQGGVPMKLISTGHYASTDNGGTITFEEPNKISFTGITYSVNATAKADVYLGGTLVSNTDFPITGTQPPTDDAGEYEKIGADSIFVQSDALSIIDTGGLLENTGLGFKLQWNGNQMTMTAHVQETRDEEYMGMPVKANIDITAVFTLEKQ